MGTSASSNGPNSGVPFDPPWLDDIKIPQDENQPDSQNEDTDDTQDDQTNQPIQPPVAPPRRFRDARRSLGDYARSGDHESLRKAIGHYSKTGMGGAHTAAKRMRVSTRSAAALFGILKSAREGTDSAINEWVSSLISRSASASEIIDEIISQVAPEGGSIDESICRESMAQAMENLISKEPNINLLNLNDNNIWALIESFLGFEAFKRLCLDIGQAFEKSTLNPRDKVSRMNEMHRYLEAEIFVQVENLRQINQNATSNQLNVILQNALKNTFLVYEGAL